MTVRKDPRKKGSIPYPSILYISWYQENDSDEYFFLAHTDIVEAVQALEDHPGDVVEIAIYQFASTDKRKSIVVQA